MKYQKYISREFIKEWENFYINYLMMLKILFPMYKKYKERNNRGLENETNTINFHNLFEIEPLLDEENQLFPQNNGETNETSKVKEIFVKQFLLEVKKVDKFYKEKTNRDICHKIKEIKEQIKNSLKNNEFKINNESYEIAIKESFRDIYLTRKFVETNLEIKDNLIRKFKKYNGKEELNSLTDKVYIEDENGVVNNIVDIEEYINDYISFNCDLVFYDETLKNLEDEIVQLFVKNFSFKYKSKTEKFLKKSLGIESITKNDYFYLGFFFCLIIFQLFIIFNISWYYDIDLENDPKFKSIFPMMRGFFIVCLYWWVHGLNILVWTKGKIKYNEVFKVDSEYSSSIEIFKKAVIFTFVLLSCLLIYIIKIVWTKALFGIFELIPINCLSLICWGSIALYFFNSYDIWNLPQIFLRIIQNIQDYHERGALFPKFFSIINYILSISIALLSFLWPKSPFLHVFWFLFTFFSSYYSFDKNAIKDLDFLGKANNNSLGEKLNYKPKFIYHLISLYDLVLRFFWILTISPEVFGTLFRPEILSVILNTFEIARKGAWNFLKEENKYLIK